jgi:hypothetical protein
MSFSIRLRLLTFPRAHIPRLDPIKNLPSGFSFVPNHGAALAGAEQQYFIVYRDCEQRDRKYLFSGSFPSPRSCRKKLFLVIKCKRKNFFRIDIQDNNEHQRKHFQKSLRPPLKFNVLCFHVKVSATEIRPRNKHKYERQPQKNTNFCHLIFSIPNPETHEHKQRRRKGDRSENPKNHF